VLKSLVLARVTFISFPFLAPALSFPCLTYLELCDVRIGSNEFSSLVSISKTPKLAFLKVFTLRSSPDAASYVPPVSSDLVERLKLLRLKASDFPVPPFPPPSDKILYHINRTTTLAPLLYLSPSHITLELWSNEYYTRRSEEQAVATFERLLSLLTSPSSLKSLSVSTDCSDWTRLPTSVVDAFSRLVRAAAQVGVEVRQIVMDDSERSEWSDEVWRKRMLEAER
jgi:hypothetical protein